MPVSLIFLLGISLTMVAYCLISSLWWRQKNQHILPPPPPWKASRPWVELDPPLSVLFFFPVLTNSDLPAGPVPEIIDRRWFLSHEYVSLKAGFEPPSEGLCPLGEFFLNLTGRDLKLISMKEGRGGTLECHLTGFPEVRCNLKNPKYVA